MTRTPVLLAGGLLLLGVLLAGLGNGPAAARDAAMHKVVCDDGRAVIGARLGERIMLLKDMAFGEGFRFFPDGAIAVVSRRPTLRLLMAVGDSSYLVEGHGMQSLTRAARVLAPGAPGSFDNGYAGISAACSDEASGELLAFYHAEDHKDMPPGEQGKAPPFYCCIALAVSKDGGGTFAKVGPVITSALAKDPKGMRDQGVGECSICPDENGRYLYCYYTEHSRLDRRGVQTCVARCPIKDKGRPGSWVKFHQGSFGEPALGGRDTPVVTAIDMQADAAMPHVSFCRKLGRYVMVLNINAYREMLERRPPEQSGIYVAFSEDGVAWSKPARLITAYFFTVQGDEYAWHPTVIWDDPEGESGGGWLCYAYNPSGGPHYMVGHRVTFAIERRAPPRRGQGHQ
jgi:hypothetical protein